jgi:hypothetical protein
MTTYILHKNILVIAFSESETYISILYSIGKIRKHLLVCKEWDERLMRYVDGRVCQMDAINIAVAHEEEVHRGAEYFDIATLHTQNKNLN